MLSLPDYLICQNTALPGAGLILYTKYPFFLGKVWLFHSEEDYNCHIDEWANNLEPIIKCKISGYRIVVTYAGSLQNVNTDPYKGVLQGIVDGMAQLYLEQRLMLKTGYYRKYQER